MPANELPRDDRDDPKQPAPPAIVLRSEELFRGQRLVLIEHAGEIYRLQITARNRLLLQK